MMLIPAANMLIPGKLYRITEFHNSGGSGNKRSQYMDLVFGLTKNDEDVVYLSNKSIFMYVESKTIKEGIRKDKTYHIFLYKKQLLNTGFDQDLEFEEIKTNDSR